MGAKHVSRRTSQICETYLTSVRTVTRKLKCWKWRQQNIASVMVTTRRIVEAERLLFAITEVVLLNRHLRHSKPLFSANGGTILCHRMIYHSYRWRNTRGQIWCLPGSWRCDKAWSNASQRPRGLRCESAAARLLWLRGRIAPGQGCVSIVALHVVR